MLACHSFLYIFLPAENEVLAKVIFSEACVILSTGGGGGWLLQIFRGGWLLQIFRGGVCSKFLGGGVFAPNFWGVSVPNLGGCLLQIFGGVSAPNFGGWVFQFSEFSVNVRPV